MLRNVVGSAELTPLESRLVSARARSSAVARPRGLAGLHHPARARNVIFLYMDGGPSQVDTFDPKPRLDKEHGQPIKMKVEPTQFNNVGTILPSPWAFKQYGESGLPVSDLFPHVGGVADELAVIRSMTNCSRASTSGSSTRRACRSRSPTTSSR